MAMRTIVKRGWGHRFISAPFVVLHVMPNCCRLPATGRKSNKAFVFKDLHRIGTVEETLRNPSRRTSAYRSLNCPEDCNRPFTRNLLWVQGVEGNPRGAGAGYRVSRRAPEAEGRSKQGWKAGRLKGLDERRSASSLPAFQPSSSPHPMPDTRPLPAGSTKKAAGRDARRPSRENRGKPRS